MAIVAAKVTVNHTISWVPASGDNLKFNGVESFSQVGLLAYLGTVNASATTAAISLGGVTGALYFGVRNTDANAIIYVDSVTPVVASTASHVLAPGKSMLIYTNTNSWYAIASAGTPEMVVVAIQP